MSVSANDRFIVKRLPVSPHCAFQLGHQHGSLRSVPMPVSTALASLDRISRPGQITTVPLGSRVAHLRTLTQINK